jgi:hypothetical protein
LQFDHVAGSATLKVLIVGNTSRVRRTHGHSTDAALAECQGGSVTWRTWASVLAMVGLIGAATGCRAGRAGVVRDAPESASQIRSTFVAEYGVPGSHSGLGAGLFDRRTGALVAPIELPKFEDSAFGGWSVGAADSLYYAESDPGPQNGTAHGPATGCSGEIYRLNRVTGVLTQLLRETNQTFSGLAASPTGSYATETQNCPETQTRLVVVVGGKQLTVPVQDADSAPLDWNNDGQQLLLSGEAPDQFQVLTVSAHARPSTTTHAVISDPGCSATAASFDAFGVLELEGCQNHRNPTRLVQLSAAGPTVLWRQAIPFHEVNLGLDIDPSKRELILNGDKFGTCGGCATYFWVSIGRLDRDGIRLATVGVTKRFVEYAAF